MANPIIKQIIQQATLNENLFGEKIVYNGENIVAIVEVGQNEAVTNGFMRLNGATVINGNGYFTVSTDNVENPKKGDKIVYNNKIYYVAGVERLDSTGGTVTLKVSYSERGYKNA